MTFGGRPGDDFDAAAGALFGQFRSRWAWFVGFGAIASLLGLVALILTGTATLASVITLGTFMMLTGAIEMAIGFGARSWSGLVFWELAGLLYLVAGLFAVSNPVAASSILTLMLGAGFLATGVVRFVIALRMRPGRRVALLVAGAVTALLGLVIVIGWPGNSLFVLGTLIGIDLLFYGLSWIVFGMSLQSAP